MYRIRKYNKTSDREILISLLEKENENSFIDKEGAITRIMVKGEEIIGFFTIRFTNMPRLQHFLIKEEYRNRKHINRSMFVMVNILMFFINGLGYKIFDIQVDKKKDYTKRIVRKVFKNQIREIREVGPDTFFLVEV